jgi:hypothetical protein
MDNAARSTHSHARVLVESRAAGCLDDESYRLDPIRQ